MAYRVVDAYRTIETYGGLDSQDVQRVIVASQPSSVVFAVQFTANEQTFNDPNLLALATSYIAEPYSEYAETALATPGVAGLYSYDDVNASNSIETRWNVTITSTDGTVSTQRDIPFTGIRPENFPQLVQQTQASLDALVASGGG